MDFLSVLNSSAAEILSPTTAAFALATIGLNVHFGYSGLLNFGQAAFMAVGAYAFAIFTMQADPTATLGWPAWLSFLVAILVAVAAAVAFGLVLGIPTLRLRGDYLAIVTIAAAEIIRFTVRTQDLTAVTGGSQGLRGQDFKGDFTAMNPLSGGTYGFGPWTATAYDTWVRIVAWSLVIVALLLVWLLMRSPWGRVIKGIREDEDAVRSLGKNVYGYKMQALVLGGVMGGLAGVMFVLPRAVQPDNFATTMTFYIWTALLLGGAATVFGPLLGSVLFWVLLAFTGGIINLLHQTGIFGDMSGSQAGQIRFVLVGLALMALVIFRPQGILGNKKELSFNV
ncbi:branched-chain amino acid ABC transporter permease [Agrococcus carbonis]|uniref:Amino acid/amide ABC transporter membrane protein 2, HAAT family n=1 Tax=Agrococcus carbonis TaxID=684552 RepID=A0A1H1QVT4_9MICO|nr:branched-chain amino acid ABC transporter permease [Agrococcus carbonis]SDS27582.1 amino acid/amide ABC transporter membrane protein 2, HAAT family [Agrococcus carbonis]